MTSRLTSPPPAGWNMCIPTTTPAASIEGLGVAPELDNVGAPAPFEPLDEGTALRRSTARFRVLEDLGTTEIGRGIRDILMKRPMFIGADGAMSPSIDPKQNVDQVLTELLAGFADPPGTGRRVFLPRLVELHGHLCRQRGGVDCSIVVNESVVIPHTTLTLAAMGSTVVVKGIDEDPFTSLVDAVQKPYVPMAVVERIPCLVGRGETDIPVQASIAYWINPPPEIFREKWDCRTIDELGRDVVRGGFLVIQSEYLRPYNVWFDARRWERHFFATLDGANGLLGLVAPTTKYAVDAALIVLRRK